MLKAKSNQINTSYSLLSLVRFYFYKLFSVLFFLVLPSNDKILSSCFCFSQIPALTFFTSKSYAQKVINGIESRAYVSALVAFFFYYAETIIQILKRKLYNKSEIKRRKKRKITWKISYPCHSNVELFLSGNSSTLLRAVLAVAAGWSSTVQFLLVNCFHASASTPRWYKSVYEVQGGLTDDYASYRIFCCSVNELYKQGQVFVETKAMMWFYWNRAWSNT